MGIWQPRESLHHCALLVALSFALVAAPSHAMLITYTASGTVTAVDPAITSVFVGDAYDLSMTIDDSIADSNADPTMGRYLGAVTSYSFAVGVYAAAASGRVEVFDDFNTFGSTFLDGFTAQDHSGTAPSLDGLAPAVFSLIILGDESSPFVALSSDAIPSPIAITSPFNPEWTRRQFSFNFGPSLDQSAIRGTLTAFQVVPEPSTALLFGVGLAGIAFRRRFDRNI